MKDAQNDALERDLLIEAIYRKYGYDFRNYSKASITRRITSFMFESGLENISQIQHKIIYNQAFFEQLLAKLSVNVTEMFRDPQFYKALTAHVFPLLRKKESFKVWHAGCASGEEVYSMAVFLKEAGIYDNCRIYATDIDESVLKKAKEGIYPDGRMKEYARNYLAAGGQKSISHYFTAQYGFVLLKKSLKKNILFTNHNLVCDSSFGQMDLIICRNVLIYFNSTLQNRVLKLFKESLAPDGFFCLGSKESVRMSPYSQDFIDISAREKIYQRCNNE